MRCVILTASIGAGHDLPAEVLRDELTARGAEVEVLDSLALAGGFVERSITSATFETPLANRLFDLEVRLLHERRVHAPRRRTPGGAAGRAEGARRAGRAAHRRRGLDLSRLHGGDRAPAAARAAVDPRGRGDHRPGGADVLGAAGLRPAPRHAGGGDPGGPGDRRAADRGAARPRARRPALRRPALARGGAAGARPARRPGGRGLGRRLGGRRPGRRRRGGARGGARS